MQQIVHHFHTRATMHPKDSGFIVCVASKSVYRLPTKYSITWSYSFFCTTKCFFCTTHNVVQCSRRSVAQGLFGPVPPMAARHKTAQNGAARGDSDPPPLFLPPPTLPRTGP